MVGGRPAVVSAGRSGLGGGEGTSGGPHRDDDLVVERRLYGRDDAARVGRVEGFGYRRPVVGQLDRGAVDEACERGIRRGALVGPMAGQSAVQSFWGETMTSLSDRCFAGTRNGAEAPLARMNGGCTPSVATDRAAPYGRRVVRPTSPLPVRYRQLSGRAVETAEEMRRQLPLVWHLDLDDGQVVFTFNSMTIEEPQARSMVRDVWRRVDPTGQHLQPRL